jgi:hypothetical protein
MCFLGRHSPIVVPSKEKVAMRDLKGLMQKEAGDDSGASLSDVA